MKTQSLILIAVLAVLATTRVTAVLLGGYGPIRDLNDPEVQKAARFAIDEHNRKTGDRLVYVRVASGESQVVAGVNYRLQIVARNGYPYSRYGGGVGTYEAVVWVKSWENFIQLTSFKRVA